MRAALVGLVGLALCAVARAEPPPARGAYIADLIDAIRGTDRATLASTRKYIQVVERNRC